VQYTDMYQNLKKGLKMDWNTH